MATQQNSSGRNHMFICVAQSRRGMSQCPILLKGCLPRLRSVHILLDQRTRNLEIPGLVLRTIPE
jgi:hypothetical protein